MVKRLAFILAALALVAPLIAQVKTSGHVGHTGHIHLGGGTVPVVNLSASSIAFANQVVNTTSAPTVLTLTNVGTGSLTISSIAVTGTDAADFAKTTSCGGTLGAGLNCTISPTFTPLSAATFSAAITITDNAAGSPHVVTLSGTGISSPPPTTLFSDDFETGDFSKWTTPINQWGYDNPFIATSPSPVHGGTYSYGQRYEAAPGPGVPGDVNRWIAVILASHTEVWTTGWVYIKSPEVDAPPPTSSLNQRKLIEWGDTNASSNCCGTWIALLDSWNGTGGTATNDNHISWNTAGINGCGSYAPQTWDLGTFSFDAWHKLEVHIKLNTPGVSDGVVDIYLDGSLTYHNAAQNIRGTCSTGITGYFFGRQVDGPPGAVIDEYRFWDDIGISTTGP